MGIDTIQTEEILLNGWSGVTIYAFLASFVLASLMARIEPTVK
jgi:hypothetical protein